MDRIHNDPAPAYNAIPSNGPFTAHAPLPDPRPAQGHTVFWRRVSTLFVIAVAACVVAHVATRQRVRVADRWGARHLYMPNLGAPQPSTTGLLMPQFHAGAEMDPLHPALFGFDDWENAVVHSPSANDTDFSIDELVPTRQCPTGRKCRARLTVEKHGNVVTVKAGYFVYGSDGKVVNIGARLRNRLAKTTSAQTSRWAALLLDKVQDRLGEDSPVIQDAIAAAIDQGRKSIASCPRTDDPRCNALFAVAEYKVALPLELDPCAKFVRSGAVVSSLAELQVECPDAKFVGNRISLSLPFCVTTCEGDPRSQRYVYMRFYAQSPNRISGLPNCISHAVVPGYNTLYPTIPECTAAPTGITRGSLYLVSLATSSAQTIPDVMNAASNPHGCGYNFVGFAAFRPTLNMLEADTCAAE